jgi:hypothetical protein
VPEGNALGVHMVDISRIKFFAQQRYRPNGKIGLAISGWALKKASNRTPCQEKTAACVDEAPVRGSFGFNPYTEPPAASNSNAYRTVAVVETDYEEKGENRR